MHFSAALLIASAFTPVLNRESLCVFSTSQTTCAEILIAEIPTLSFSIDIAGSMLCATRLRVTPLYRTRNVHDLPILS